MIETIMLWWRTRNTRVDAAEEHRGYEYAAVTLLDMGELGAEELRDMVLHDADCPFNEGVRRALCNWRKRSEYNQVMNYGRAPDTDWPTLHDIPAVDYDRGCRS